MSNHPSNEAAAPGGTSAGGGGQHGSPYGDFTSLLAATAAGANPMLGGAGAPSAASSIPTTLRALQPQPPSLSTGFSAGSTTAGPTGGRGGMGIRALEWPPSNPLHSSLALMNSLGVAPGGSAVNMFRQATLQQQLEQQQRQATLQQQLEQQREELRHLQEEQERRTSAAQQHAAKGEAEQPAGGGRQSREDMLRSYREENAEFYQSLVDSVGLENANAMVADAVDDTLREEDIDGGSEDEGHEREGGEAPGVVRVEESEDEQPKRHVPAVMHTIRQPKTGEVGIRETPFSMLYNNHSVASKKRATDAPAAGPGAQAKRPRPQAQPVARSQNLLQALFPGAGGMPTKANAAPSANPGTLAAAKGWPVTLVSASGERLGKVSGPAARTAMSKKASVPLVHGLSRLNRVARGFDDQEKQQHEAELTERMKAHRNAIHEGDPEFCQLLFAAAGKEHTTTDDPSELLMRGLLNIDEGSMRNLNDSALPLKAYLEDFVQPRPNTMVAGHLQWHAVISSEDGKRIVRNMIYQRRKAMKRAAELVFHTMKGEQSNLRAGGKQKGLAKGKSKAHKTSEAGKDGLVEELMETLATQEKQHEDHAALITKKLREEHEAELDEVESEYKTIVSDLMKAHRKEIQELKKQIRTSENVHKTFLDSYVEASLDSLRNSSESPALESKSSEAAE